MSMNTLTAYKILIVEEDREICMMIQEFLHYAGIISTVEFAHDCVEANDKAETESYDMIFADGTLTREHIKSVIKNFRSSDSNLNQIPIFFISPKNESLDVNLPDSHKLHHYSINSFLYDNFYSDVVRLAQ